MGFLDASNFSPSSLILFSDLQKLLPILLKDCLISWLDLVDGWMERKQARTHTHTHTYTGWEVGDPCSASLDYMYFHSWLLTSKARLCKFQSPPTVLSLNSTSSDRLGYRPSPLLSWLRLLWPWSNIAASSKAIESRSPTKH